MSHHAGDSRHIHNIQINKVIGENKKCVFYFIEKTIWIFWPTQYIPMAGNKCLITNLYDVYYVPDIDLTPTAA